VDILLLQASVLNLPSGKRASALVYDGTIDLGLWRPPGPDRDLWEAYGEELRAVLDKERKRLPGHELPLNGVLRLHPGKLHCDFMVWVGGRPSHGDTEASPAPSIEAIGEMTRKVMEFVAQHDVVRVAFPALGKGRGEAPVADRLAAIVKAVAAYKEACLQAGRPAHIEEVVVCDPSSANVAKAKRSVEKLARAGYAEPPPAPPSASSSSSASSQRARSSSSTASRTTTGRTRGAPKLNPELVAQARTRAPTYDRSHVYIEGNFFIHPTFGVGQVKMVKVPERMVVVLFEDGHERTMIHSR
jgi:O-acetyl-ADP-ribose deacetylase (regulator of RNase III)